jgi:hypothetical protein
MTVFPHPHYSFLFPRLKIKLNGCSSYTTEVMEAVLNTLTDRDFQDAFKKWQMRTVHTHGKSLL